MRAKPDMQVDCRRDMRTVQQKDCTTHAGTHRIVDCHGVQLGPANDVVDQVNLPKQTGLPSRPGEGGGGHCGQAGKTGRKTLRGTGNKSAILDRNTEAGFKVAEGSIALTGVSMAWPPPMNRQVLSVMSKNQRSLPAKQHRGKEQLSSRFRRRRKTGLVNRLTEAAVASAEVVAAEHENALSVAEEREQREGEGKVRAGVQNTAIKPR